MSLAQDQARFSASTEIDGEFIASVGLIEDKPDREAWAVMFTTFQFQDFRQVRRMWHLYRDFRDAIGYRVVRAWVPASDRIAMEFAERLGFRYECGPAKGLSPAGADLNLMVWRRE